jgi:UDP-N-acetylmuramoyl-tripeptide--D-alanyl-D-alanine ligase
MNIGLLILGLAWLGGVGLRLVRQARFYQLEEYMPVRYTRWWFGALARWLPKRPTVAAAVGVVLTIVLWDAPSTPMPYIVALVVIAVVCVPPREREVKKPLRYTPRAQRLLVTAGLLAALVLFAALWLLLLLAPTLSDKPRVAAALVLGYATWWAAPLWLILANVAMMPVEAAIRAAFVAQAWATLAEANLKVIGITGSYGKTTTKTFLAHILNQRFKAYPTPKSYNTLMGVSLAINTDLAKDRSYDYFIAEMGAYIPGEIERLCDLTHPSMSIVVEVGPQHLERFGTLENIASAKYEIIKALPANGAGFFNWDNPHVRAMFERGHPRTRIAVSREADPAQPPHGLRLIASDVQETLDGLSFTVTDTQDGARETFSTPIIGGHNVTNILLAAAVALHEGMPLKAIARAVRTLQPAESRLVRQVTAEGITIINDAYSANPAGVVYALRVLGLHSSGRRVLITPGMVELADLMERENRKLGIAAAQHATDVILVGAQQTAPIRAGLAEAGFAAERVQVVETLKEAVTWYQAHLRAGDAVLFMNDLPDIYAR